VSRKAIQWLYKEIPILVDKGILSSETADKLRQYYSDRKGPRVALIIFSLLGSLLIGSGIILLLAHNWQELSRSARTILSLLPLILAQLLVGWTILKRNESDSWKEGTATFLFLMIGASAALIEQTYHISFYDSHFLLFWMLLGLPLVYFMRATVPAMLYIIGITFWSGSAKFGDGNAILFWPLAALIIPHFLQIAKKDSYFIRFNFFSLIISICLCVAIGITLLDILPTYWMIIYGSFFAILYLIGVLWVGKFKTNLLEPFKIVGLLGAFTLSYILTYRYIWKTIYWKFPQFAEAKGEYIFAVILFLIALVLFVEFIRRDKTAVISFAFLPLVTLAGHALYSFNPNTIFPVILFNLYLSALGINTIAEGVKKEHIGTINLGIVILILLVVARFFDSDMSFITRGIAFIIIGIGFLLTNLLLMNRWKNKT